MLVSGVHAVGDLKIDKRKHDGLECGIGLVLMPESVVALFKGLLGLLLFDFESCDPLLQIEPWAVYEFDKYIDHEAAVADGEEQLQDVLDYWHFVSPS